MNDFISWLILHVDAFQSFESLTNGPWSSGSFLSLPASFRVLQSAQTHSPLWSEVGGCVGSWVTWTVAAEGVEFVLISNYRQISTCLINQSGRKTVHFHHSLNPHGNILLVSLTVWACRPCRTDVDVCLQQSDGFTCEMSSQTEEEDSCLCGPAAVLCSVSGRSEGSSLYQLWTPVLQTVHHLILGPASFIRSLLLSPVWRQIQDSQSEQNCTK